MFSHSAVQPICCSAVLPFCCSQVLVLGVEIGGHPVLGVGALEAHRGAYVGAPIGIGAFQLRRLVKLVLCQNQLLKVIEHVGALVADRLTAVRKAAAFQV